MGNKPVRQLAQGDLAFIQGLLTYNAEEGNFTTTVPLRSQDVGRVLGTLDGTHPVLNIQKSNETIRCPVARLVYLWETGELPTTVKIQDGDPSNTRFSNLLAATSYTRYCRTLEEKDLAEVQEVYQLLADGTLAFKDATKGPVKLYNTVHGYVTLIVVTESLRVSTKLHRLVYLLHTGTLPKSIDHRDQDKTNNHPSNLRATSGSNNSLNTKLSKNNTSGVNGVSYCSSTNKWSASFQYKDIVKSRKFHSKGPAVTQRRIWEKQYVPAGVIYKG